MFSGIVEDVGEVVSFSREGSPCRMFVRTSLDLSDTRPGDSIAVDGVCLTVVEIKSDTVLFELLPETLRCSVAGSYRRGSKVNLERSLRVGQRVSGHFVFGHVDGVLRLISRVKDGASDKLVFRLPEALAPYVVRKGSVSLNGVSLTVGNVRAADFCVWLISHTLAHTNFSGMRVGDSVNFEIDMLARYARNERSPKELAESLAV